MTQVVASTQHASTSARMMPYIPASSPSLWAELPSFPCSVEALSQKHKHVQEQPVALENLFDDDEDYHADHQYKAGDGAAESTVSPSSRGGERSASTSVDTEVRGPVLARDPFELFDVGSPWTQVNISTQWQRRLWLGKALVSDPSSDDTVEAARGGSTEHRERPHKQRDDAVPQPRGFKERRPLRASETAIVHKEQKLDRKVSISRTKTRLAVELSDDDSDEEQGNRAGPSMPRRHPAPPCGESLPQAKVSPLQRPSALVRQVISPPRAAAQTPRPRPKPRVSSVRAPATAAQQPHAPLHATTDSEDDAPSATQFFTRKKRRRVSAECEVDQVEGREALQRAHTPMADDASLLHPTTAELDREDANRASPDSVGPAVTTSALVRPSAAHANSQASESTALSPTVATTHGFPARALNDRTISFGQLSKDDEDALESFVEGMDSEDDEEGASGLQGMKGREAFVVPVASGEASAGNLRPPSPRRSRTPLSLGAAGAWLSASPSPPPLIEDYEDDDDPSVPSGLAPLLPDLDEEKRRGYFAQFDSLLGLSSAAGSRSVPRAGTSIGAWADGRERDRDEGVGVEWPTTPSARFGSAAAAGRALGRAESDSRLLPNRFTGFSRPIVSCSQLLATDGAGEGEGVENVGALNSPSTHRARLAGNRNTSKSNSAHSDSGRLVARSRNAAGMGLVRKTWGSTWREDGTRLVRGRVVRRASPPPGPVALGAVDPGREREMWADEMGQTGKAQMGKTGQVAKRAGRTSARAKRKSGAGSTSSAKE